MPVLVPNKKPALTIPDYSLAVVSEYPGKTELETGEPFTGVSGQILNATLTNNRILRQACYLGNVCQIKTPETKKGPLSPYDTWELDGHPSTHYLQQGLATLREDMEALRPNLILLLGNAALRAAGVELPISSYRGSLFQCRDTTSPFFGYKCLASYNPAYVFRDFKRAPIFDFDIGRAREEATTPNLDLPRRSIEVDLTPFEIVSRLRSFLPGSICSVDIEGTPETGIKCIGISDRPDHAFVFWPSDFEGYQLAEIWSALGLLLGDASVRKVLQNSLFDNFALAYVFGMPIRNVWWDTMLGGWEIFPELEKGLDMQTSIWTREPYYKFERKIQDKRVHAIYCGKDACVTLEIAQAQEKFMTPAQLKHFRFNMGLLPPLLYMEHRGIKYDSAQAKTRLDKEVVPLMDGLITRINESAKRVTGRDHNINPNSSSGEKSISTLLYRDLKFPAQYKKERGRKTDIVTADKDALLTLAKNESQDSIIHLLLEWRAFESQRKQLSIGADPDGRVRASYNLVGTETGRMSCYGSPTGSGTNLQTIMHIFRDLYRADDGFDFFKCDLSGADGWTVAAWCNHFNDPTMLEDYLFGPGFKPAKVLMLLYLTGASINNLPRDVIYERMKDLITETGWLYPACKAVQHGGNYGMKPNKVSETIKIRSYKETGKAVYVEPKKCAELQNLFLNIRYRGVVDWQEKYVQKELLTKRALGSASGHIRPFFGRQNDHETFTSACSHEPQANTTFATNTAVDKLWRDSSNRLGYYFDPATAQEGRRAIEAACGTQGLIYILNRGRRLQDPTQGLVHSSVAAIPLIEPLHQVHDEMSGQWPTVLREWARKKIPSYFDTTLDIAHQKIIIPFEGKYGTSWGTCINKI